MPKQLAEQPTKLSEDTQLTLDLKTIAVIIGLAITLAMGYFTLKSDIKAASDKSEESISTIEFNVSQETVKQIIRETQNMMHGGHTTMYLDLTKGHRDEIQKAKEEIIGEIRRKH
jgi:hypothetical protein|tara:strand:- start:40 stop:384 length:345 start_codon:yes stop_codon:yes gene_type:complete